VTNKRMRMRLGSARRRRFWSIDAIQGSGLIYQHIWIDRYKFFAGRRVAQKEIE